MCLTWCPSRSNSRHLSPSMPRITPDPQMEPTPSASALAGPMARSIPNTSKATPRRRKPSPLSRQSLTTHATFGPHPPRRNSRSRKDHESPEPLETGRRLPRGRTPVEARFTAPPSLAGLPDMYRVTFEEIKSHSVILAIAGREDWILCQITSKAYTDSAAVELRDSDFALGGLQLVSYARPSRRRIRICRVGRIGGCWRSRIQAGGVVVRAFGFGYHAGGPSRPSTTANLFAAAPRRPI